MDFVAPLWTFAPGAKVALLMLAIVGQIALTFRMYQTVGNARMKAGREGRITAETYSVVGDEPADLALLTRALANQFELPVLFFVVVLGHLAVGTASWITVVLAILFVAARFVHANEMTGRNRVMLRRKLFFRSMGIFVAMLAEFALAAIFVALV